MRILTGFMPPSSGAARIDGFDTVEASLQARSRVGYLPESVPLYGDLTVRQYLDYMGALHGLPAQTLRQQIEETVETVQCVPYIDTRIGKLSKGFRQRVGIAQAILHDPPVVILDEPTAGIDPSQVVETRNLIKRLGENHTVLLSTHILPEVSMVCDRVIIIHEGRIVADGDPAAIAGKLSGGEVIEVDVRGPSKRVATALNAIPGVASVATDAAGNTGTYRIEAKPASTVLEQVASVIVGAGWTLLRLQPASVSLERIFIQLTKDEPVAHS
jgi:ABC-2 type transport system ATP-binding protein